MKVMISYFIEKLHRYCFDNIYQQNHSDTFKDKCLLRLLSLCQLVLPKYRSILKLEFGGKYNRYSL